MKPGLKHTSKMIVNSTNVASAMESGNLPVFATPSMIALMENAASKAVSGVLPEGSTTVGTLVNVVHSKATAEGEEVSATAELMQIDGRKLIFHVSAADSQGIIGEGIHERFIVDAVKFMDRVNFK